MAARCGMSQTEYLNTTLAYLFQRHKAFEESAKGHWERARQICFFVVKTVDYKNRIKKPEDVFRLPWDKREVINLMDAPPITEEEIRQFERDMREKYGHVNQSN
jgi:hypothetical protein